MMVAVLATGAMPWSGVHVHVAGLRRTALCSSSPRRDDNTMLPVREGSEGSTIRPPREPLMNVLRHPKAERTCYTIDKYRDLRV